ncbi:hypothetical protein VPH35_054800 [Triticum aestivum]
MEVRERRWGKGGVVRRPRKDLARARRRRTGAGDRDLVSLLLSWSLPCLPGIPPLTSPTLTTSATSPRPRPHITSISASSTPAALHPTARRHDCIQQGTSNTHPPPCHTCYFTRRGHCSRIGFWHLLCCRASVLCGRNLNFVCFGCSSILALRSQHIHYNMFVICRDGVKKLDWDHGVNQMRMKLMFV